MNTPATSNTGTEPRLGVSRPDELQVRSERSFRSQAWTASDTVSGLLHRSSLRAGGVEGVADGSPIVGIANTWSELVHCNVHLRETAEQVKAGVRAAGGHAVEFPTMSLSENLMKPTAMLYRNLLAIEIEETLRAHPLDAVVLLGSCDKTTPALLMGAISANIPAIMFTGGPSDPAICFGRELGVGTDLWRYTDDLRAGRMERAEYDQLEAALIPSHGHCNEMGTASTMAIVVEALGMALSGSAVVPATDPLRRDLAERCGAQAVAIAHANRRPQDVLDDRSIHNALVAIMAIGGSTNAIIHLAAIAGRLGLAITPERIRSVSESVPVIANVRPVGQHLAHDLARAGGLPAIAAELGDRFDRTAATIDGREFGQLAHAPTSDGEIVRSVDRAISPVGAITAVTGNLAPDGAIIKRSAATAKLLHHRGPAVVFEGVHDLMARIEDPDLPITPESVMVLRNVGPVGGPGMPEWGMIPIPDRLLRAGVEDMLRISDARMSGTAYGTIVLHVAPEAAIGGPLGLVRDGDEIELDVDRGLLHLHVDDEELSQRGRDWVQPADSPRGWIGLHQRHVLQAPQGCDLDFLLPHDDSSESDMPTGLFEGWLSGW